jgi:hypothetical protein
MEQWRLEQRQIIIERSGGVCEFEYAVAGLMPGSTHYGGQPIVECAGDICWVRCSETRGLAVAHLPRRWKCGIVRTDDGIPLIFHPDVAVAACWPHHAAYDSRLHRDAVRAPEWAKDKARKIIVTTLAVARARGEVAVDVGLSRL